MTFTQEFIDVAILEHKKWLEKVTYIVEYSDLPIAWKSGLLSVDTELSSLLTHMKNEIFDHDHSKYTELKYELEYTKEKIQKMNNCIAAICILFELSKKKLFDASVQSSIKISISIIAQEINTMSDDIITRLIRWKEL